MGLHGLLQGYLYLTFYGILKNKYEQDDWGVTVANYSDICEKVLYLRYLIKNLLASIIFISFRWMTHSILQKIFFSDFIIEKIGDPFIFGPTRQ
jgi:hypothetical protein